MKKFTILWIVLFLAAGCAAPINRHTAESYYQRAKAAQYSGDWHTAQEYYRRSIINAELGGIDETQYIVVLYEYGRASGVICEWKEATDALLKSYELDKKTNGPSYMALYELAQLNYSRQVYEEASTYYERAYLAFEEEQVDTQDPIGYSVFLEEYSDVLKRTNNPAQIPELMDRAEAIKAAFPGKQSHTDKTPYGTQCKTS